MLPEEDLVRLRHMLDAARQALVFTAGRQREDLDQDTMLLFAVVRAIEIVGEAAAHVGIRGRGLLPEVPWPSVVGMRHRLVHAYFDVDPDRVWDVVSNELSPLITDLERALGENGAGSGERQPG